MGAGSGRSKRATTAIRHQSEALLDPHLGAIAEIAWDHEPDWDAVYEGRQHDWCGDASRAITQYLNAAETGARLRSGGLRGRAHTWVELPDGTIIDATIEQYIDRGNERCVHHDEVPWQTDDIGTRVAVIPTNHALHAEYTPQTKQ